MSAGSAVAQSRQQRQPRLAQRRIVGHHQHVDEEPVDRRARSCASSRIASRVAARCLERRVDARPPRRSVRQQRELRRLRQASLQLVERRGRRRSTSFVMFLTRLNSAASASKSVDVARLRQRFDALAARLTRLDRQNGTRPPAPRRHSKPRCSNRCAARSAKNSNERRPSPVAVDARQTLRSLERRRCSGPSDRLGGQPELRQIDQDLDDALRRAAQAVRIARAGRLLARGEQADDRVELVGERDRRPGHRGLAELRARRRRVGFDADRQVVEVDRLPDLLGLALLRARRCRPSCPAAR